jgi:acyl-CoA thioester hydrolase
VWVGSVGRTSFVVEGEIRDGEQVLSRSRVVVVRVDPERQRPLALSPGLVELLGSEVPSTL